MFQSLPGLRYGDDPRQALDLFLPERESPRLFMFVHGGGWRGGDKQQYQAMGELLANFGYAVALPNHRLAPEHPHPAAAQDVAAALAWVLKTAKESGIRRNGIILAGHSSGAHLAALVALHPHLLEEAGVARGSVAGVIGISGIYDLTAYQGTPGEGGAAAYLAPAFGSGPAAWAEASPVRHVHPGAPPFLLAHAEFDYPGAAAQSAAMAAALQQAGANAEVVEVPERDHISILTGVQSLFDPLALSLALFLRAVRQ